MECFSNKSLEGLLHHALRLCDCRSVALRACETAGHPSSEEMWRWCGEDPLSSVVSHSPCHHSRLAMQLSLFFVIDYNLCALHLPPATSTCFLTGWWSETAWSASPSAWLVLESAQAVRAGCNRPAGIYSFRWLCWASLTVQVWLWDYYRKAWISNF